MRELSNFLLKLTGRCGEASFHMEDMDHPRAVFAIAYVDGKPAGRFCLL